MCITVGVQAIWSTKNSTSVTSEIHKIENKKVHILYSSRVFMIFTLWSPCTPPPCVSIQMRGITGGYKILILSTQVKQGKVHRILITPVQSYCKAPLKNTCVFIAMFPPKRVESQKGYFFNHSTQFYYPLGWEGNWKNPRAVLLNDLCVLTTTPKCTDLQEFQFLCVFQLKAGPPFGVLVLLT